jgi:hypothetical protein
MNNNIIPDNITKVDRDQFVTYLDVTPSAQSMDFEILGVGVTTYAITYNPQIDTEKWIIEKNARNDHTSNQKQSSVEQKMYKGDPCFEFAHAGLDKLNYTTHILDIDRWNGNGSTYPAKLSDGLLAVTQKGGENAVLSYDLYYNGDPKEGTVTFDSTTGKPTFTETASL